MSEVKLTPEHDADVGALVRMVHEEGRYSRMLLAIDGDTVRAMGLPLTWDDAELVRQLASADADSVSFFEWERIESLADRIEGILPPMAP